jgi:methylated-DNA-[protein]-cysteine S-methyltransferase
VGICEEEGGISKIFFQKESCLEGYILSQTPLIEKAATQLSEYFAGTRKSFDLQLAPNGTDFQQKVWAALQTIPFGQTCSYKDIALQIGKPKAYRAVGMANNKNPIVIVIPCHRVIGSDGTLIGYGGGLPVKEYLLKLEGKS